MKGRDSSEVFRANLSMALQNAKRRCQQRRGARKPIDVLLALSSADRAREHKIQKSIETGDLQSIEYLIPTTDGNDKHFEARSGRTRQINGLARCHGWIGASKLPPFQLPRAPTDIWDSFFEHFAQRFEWFSKI